MAVAKNSQARRNDRLVLWTIADFVHDKIQVAWPSQWSIHSKSGLGEKTVLRSIQRLVKAGDLFVFRSGDKSYESLYAAITEHRKNDTPPKPPLNRRRNIYWVNGVGESPNNGVPESP